jgi:hypothetical protein
MRKDGPQPRLSRTRLGSRGWHSGGRDSRAHPFVGTAGNWFWAPKNCALRSRPCRRGRRAASRLWALRRRRNEHGWTRSPTEFSTLPLARARRHIEAQRPAFGYPCPAPAFIDGERRPRITEGGMGAGARTRRLLQASQCRQPAHKATAPGRYPSRLGRERQSGWGRRRGSSREPRTRRRPVQRVASCHGAGLS